MGTAEGEKDAAPPHTVRISEFYLGRYEISQAQWRAVMGDNPAEFARCGGNCPVEHVSWEKVQLFLQKASRALGMKVRLPTEAEWEYAARGGKAHERWAGADDEGLVGRYAHVGQLRGGTREVGLGKPNAFGLYDMTGNVWEWCADWFGVDYYSVSPPADPKGPDKGDFRVLRGGAWRTPVNNALLSRRNRFPTWSAYHTIGFRLALDAEDGRKLSAGSP